MKQAAVSTTIGGKPGQERPRPRLPTIHPATAPAPRTKRGGAIVGRGGGNIGEARILKKIKKRGGRGRRCAFTASPSPRARSACRWSTSTTSVRRRSATGHGSSV